ncbi:C2 domain-containing protein [Globomyces pollinis-pini]|nr:C2 domain-containing protein [Globomyces pollinis-pini]
MAYCGVMEVRVIEGKDLRNVDHMSKMDPYIVFKIDSQVKKTKEANNGGKTPVWNETLTMNVIPGQSVLSVEVWDKNTLADKMIGNAMVNLEKVFDDGTEDMWVEVRHPTKGSSAGMVRLIFFFQSKAVVSPTRYPSTSTPMNVGHAPVQAPPPFQQQAQPVYQQAQPVYQQAPQPQYVYQQPPPQPVYAAPIQAMYAQPVQAPPVQPMYAPVGYAPGYPPQQVAYGSSPQPYTQGYPGFAANQPPPMNGYPGNYAPPAGYNPNVRPGQPAQYPQPGYPPHY